MKRQVASAVINTATLLLPSDTATQRVHGVAAWLCLAIDRLILALAVAERLDNAAALDLEYAEAMVEVFDEWLADKGLRNTGGGLQ
jgi:hypothetical protein